MSDCNRNCESCSKSQNCGVNDMHEKLNQFSHIRKVVAVSSGKGGVGKSSVTAMLAVMMARRGHKVGILDADITGPSIPKAFGITRKARNSEMGILPEETHMGIKVMSINLLLEKEDQPVVWRGPILSGAVKQFWTDVAWGDLDILFIDMPPGTGDVPLTIFQRIPLDGVVIVSTPQSLVQMIVSKAQKMASMLNIPILGMVENMSYVSCPDCGRKISLFGDSSALDKAAGEMGIKVLARLPMDAEISRLCDSGEIEKVVCDEINSAVDSVEQLLK
ncbi:MAG TPA: Mrp/NBP35 family ATP-binding protein [Candidatus Avimonas sp.]|nr:Mrp/NBP35 family ATP-binding protein [Clostridiales bacterium]HPU58646.1 Mrp/NBP35 family ATP-binding protein [Candidatus Avimonas sp.]